MYFYGDIFVIRLNNSKSIKVTNTTTQRLDVDWLKIVFIQV